MKKAFGKGIIALAVCFALSAAGCGQTISPKEKNFEKQLERYDKMDAKDAEKEIEQKLQALDGGKKTTAAAEQSAGGALDDPAYYTYFDQLAANYDKSLTCGGVSEMVTGLGYNDNTAITNARYINGNIYISTGARPAVEVYMPTPKPQLHGLGTARRRTLNRILTE